MLVHLLICGESLNSPDLTIRKPHFDAVRMGRAAGQEILDNAAGQGAGALIFFQNNLNRHPRFDLSSVPATDCHFFFFFSFLSCAAFSRSAKEPIPEPLAGSSE